MGGCSTTHIRAIGSDTNRAPAQLRIILHVVIADMCMTGGDLSLNVYDNLLIHETLTVASHILQDYVLCIK